MQNQSQQVQGIPVLNRGDVVAYQCGNCPHKHKMTVLRTDERDGKQYLLLSAPSQGDDEVGMDSPAAGKKMFFLGADGQGIFAANGRKLSTVDTYSIERGIGMKYVEKYDIVPRPEHLKKRFSEAELEAAGAELMASDIGPKIAGIINNSEGTLEETFGLLFQVLGLDADARQQLALSAIMQSLAKREATKQMEINRLVESVFGGGSLIGKGGIEVVGGVGGLASLVASLGRGEMPPPSGRRMGSSRRDPGGRD